MSLSDIAIAAFFIVVLLIMLVRLRSKPPRVDPSEIPKILAEVDMHVREGRQWQAIELLELALQHHVGNRQLTAKLQMLRSEPH